MQLTPFGISGLLTAVTFIPLTIFIFLNSKTKVAKLFGYHCFMVSGWGIGAFVVSIIPNAQTAFWTWIGVYCFVLFIPVSLFHMTVEMVQYKFSKVLLIIVYIQAFIFLILNLSGFLSSPEMRYLFSMYWFKGNKYLWISFSLWEATVAIAHSILIWHYWSSGNEKRKQLNLLIVASVLGFAGGTMNFLPGLGFKIYPIGNFLVPIYSILIGYAILQYQLFDIRYVLRKGLVYAMLITTISIMYFVTFLLFEPVMRQLLGDQQSIFSGLLAAIILGFIYAPMRLKIEYFIDNTIFRTYRQEIQKENYLMEQELVRSEKFKMVSFIMRGIVYEIRNPLTAIKTRSLFMAQKVNQKDFIEKSAKIIDNQVERINELLSQLTKFSNPSLPQMKLHSLYPILDDVLKILNREFEEKNIIVIKKLRTQDSLNLKIDPSQMQQAVYNIIINAIHAMGEKGILTITTEIINVDDNDKKDDFFVLRIADTGKGIPPEFISKVFDPFFSMGERGAGLGLSITHRIIKEHNGSIEVQSQLNEGTTFIIKLPLNYVKA